MTSFTYTPTDPADAYQATTAYGHSFEPGKAVTLNEKNLKGTGLTLDQVIEKLDGNPEFTKDGEDRQAVTEARRRAKEAEAAEKLRAEAAEATAAAAVAGPR